MKKVILITIMLGAMLWAIEPFVGTCGPTPWWLRDNSGSQNEDRYRGICVINDSLAWVVGWDHWGIGNGIVWKRTGGKHSHTWKNMTDSVPNATSYHLNDVCFVDAMDGWIVGEKRDEPNKYRGVVYKTTNGGTNWIDVTPSDSITGPHPTPFLKVKFVNSSEGYISCGNGAVLKTGNGGQSWSRTSSDPWNNDNNISVWYNGLWVDSNNSDKLWVGGDAFGVLAKSDSGGISWTSYQPSAFETTYTFPQGAGTPYGTRFANSDVEFVHPDTGFVALSYGKIGETTDEYTVGSNLNI